MLFRRYCASCHGVDGRGHGPASVALKHGAPDLTRISQRNGGTFPFRRVKEIIEGNESGPLAHGSREMPVWGPIFHEVDSDMDLGEVRLDAVTKDTLPFPYSVERFSSCFFVSVDSIAVTAWSSMPLASIAWPALLLIPRLVASFAFNVEEGLGCFSPATAH